MGYNIWDAHNTPKIFCDIHGNINKHKTISKKAQEYEYVIKTGEKQNQILFSWDTPFVFQFLLRTNCKKESRFQDRLY
jgi:hypothetical protein